MKKIFTLFVAALCSAAMMADVYSVAGSPASLFGAEWDEKNTATEMTLEGNTYVWRAKNVYLPAGKVEYKVVLNHSWDTSWPVSGNRYSNELTEGMYNVMIEYHPDTHSMGLTPERIGDKAQDVTLYFVNYNAWENVYAYVWNDDYMIGDLKSWPGTQMTLTGDSVDGKAVYSFTFADNYNKIIFNNGTGGAGNQTSDMIWNAATPYFYDGIWYASLNDINPAAETKFYISGDYSLVGAGSVWDPKAIKSLEDSYTLHLQPGVYLLKISLDGTEATWKGFSDLSEVTPGLTSRDNINAIAFTLAEAGDVVVTYKVENEVVTFTVVGTFFTIEDGYYLMAMSKDFPELTQADKFAPNEHVDGEYLLNTTLTEGDQIAVISVYGNAIDRYYYGEQFYYVDADHAGAATIYFRPAGNEEWTENGGYFYVANNGDEGVSNTVVEGKAFKTISNGMLIIEKAGVRYNVMGQIIR